MVVHYLRFPSRSARNVLHLHLNSRKFSSASAPRKSRTWIKLLGGAVLLLGASAGGAVGVSAYDPAYRTVVEQTIPLSSTVLSLVLGKAETMPLIPLLPAISKPEITSAQIISEDKVPIETPEKLDDSLQAVNLEHSSQAEKVINEDNNPLTEPEKLIESETIKCESETPPPKPKKKKKKKKTSESSETSPVLTEENKETKVDVVAEVSKPVPEISKHVPEVIESVTEDPLQVNEPAMESEIIPEAVETSPMVVTENSAESSPISEELPSTSTVISEIKEDSGDVLEGIISSSLAEEAPVSDSPDDFSLDPQEISEDEAAIIMDALNTLDYEPVLSDTVLELLVGKAASREKAVVATISRLENAMASVVNEVQIALEHHNAISALVSAAKLKAQSVSEATNQTSAKENLADLIESSALVHTAFVQQEEIESKVTRAFEKLSEIITKAEQFDLRGPVNAARALLGKSKNDYYTSCQTAQEHQVDHALLAHYQKSVGNRRKVLEQELAILQDHFPKQHNQLNQTFDSATHHRAQVDELNTLITYLSNKVGRLERELDEQQSSELEKLKMVAEAQKLEDAKLLEERLRMQKEQLRCDYEMKVQTEIDSAVVATRDECARQADRQVAQIKQELQQKTELQIRDLTAFWSDEAALRESTVEAEYQCKLETSNKVLEGVSDMLDTQRSRYENSTRYNRLLNLTTALYQCVYYGGDINPGKLQDTVELIKREFEDDVFVSVVSDSLANCHTPSTSFPLLKHRLEELEQPCRTTSLVTSEECGIGSRLLSRVLHLLTLRDVSYDVPPEEGGSVTLYYLAKARSEMEKYNLDLATRYINQLVGQPRQQVQGWLNDARSLLELQQSTKLLMNYAKLKNNDHL